MPYPHIVCFVGAAWTAAPPERTSVKICAICGRIFPTCCFCVPRILWEDSFVAAWVWQGCHTLLICAYPCNLWEALLRQKLLWVLCNPWENCNVGALLALASGKAEWG